MFQVEKLLRTYCKSEVVFRQNTPGREMYVVYSGAVDLVVEGAQGGRETRLATLGPGEFFGEMALVDGSARSASAIAVEENTRLIVLDRAKLVDLLRHEPEIGVIMMETFCRRIRAMNRTLAQARA